MRGRVTAGAMALALCGSAATAQQPGRVFEQGPVVVINEVRIMPGQRRAYAQELATRWRGSMEEAKRRGEVLDYRVYANTHPRRGEGDFFFITTYRDAAVQDVSFAERERRTSGAPPPAAAPETLFEILSTTMLREQVFVAPLPPARR
ncbi:MAG TPA: hypothetical protein VF699_07885 [Caulobacteraceae bacterium]|jgi:hypothetical protein